MTLHSCNKERQWNYLITFAISIKEPPAVYLSPPLSTVSQFMQYTRRCTDESFPLSQMLMYVITLAIRVLLTNLSEQKICDMTRKYYFDSSVDYGDSNISSSGTIRFDETAWKRGLKQPKNPLMYWV